MDRIHGKREIRVYWTTNPAWLGYGSKAAPKRLSEVMLWNHSTTIGKVDEYIRKVKRSIGEGTFCRWEFCDSKGQLAEALMKAWREQRLFEEV